MRRPIFGATAKRGAGLGSQVINTFTNLLVTIQVAREASVEGFGHWTLAYVAYLVGLHLARGSLSTGLLVSAPGGAQASRGIRSGGATLTVVVGAAFGVLWLPAAAIQPEETRVFTVGLALVLPFLYLQDYLRYAAFEARREPVALAIDCIWLVTQVVTFAIIYLLTSLQGPWDGGVAAAVAWEAGAVVSSIVGAVSLRTRLDARASLDFLRVKWSKLWRLAFDSILVIIGTHSIPAIVAALAGIAATAHLRAAQTLMGGLSMLVLGMTPVGIVAAQRAILKMSAPRIYFIWCLGIGVAAGIYGVLLLLLPGRVGAMLVGDSWAGASMLLYAFAVQGVLRAPATGGPVVLKAMNDLSSLIKLRSLLVVPSILPPSVGAAFWGAHGAAWGITMATFITGFAYAVCVMRSGEGATASVRRASDAWLG